jgi:NAD(P)H dehydrogenase (quinone)
MNITLAIQSFLCGAGASRVIVVERDSVNGLRREERMLLVTGANGNLAGAVIANLRTRVDASEIAVATRDPNSARARELKGAGIEVRLGDVDAPEGLAGTFRGIRKALIISTYSDNQERLRQNLAALEAARAAGVEHVLYTSFLGAGPDSLAEHSQLVHYPTEQAILASGVTYTILRHALYAEIIVNDLDETLAGGVLRRCGGDAAVAYIAREDLGVSAAAVLAEDGHENRIYSETMTETKTGDELARAISETFGSPVRYEPVAAEDWPDFMMRQWGFPESLARSTVGTMRAIEAGQFDITSSDYEAITGHPARNLEQFLADVKSGRARG